jgi:hypothetical protein
VGSRSFGSNWRGWARSAAIACLLAGGLAACSGGEDEPLPEYRIGGTVTGLAGTIVLQNNGSDDLSITSSGSFTFATTVRRGDTYNVSIRTQPRDQACTVGNASGVAAADVGNVLVNCIDAGIPTYTVGGTVSGLTGSVVLRNGGELLTVRADGAWAFATRVRSGTPYSVTIATQPEGQTCSVANGTGTVGTGNVTDVAVTCITPEPSTFTIGGTVSGLDGQLVLRNGSENLTVTRNGPYAFATRVTSGTAYSVSVATQPSGQECSVSNSSGSVGQGNVTNVNVSCTTTAGSGFTIGGSVTGLDGTVVLGLRGERLSVSANGPFTFATRVANGETYAVTVATQPPGQACTVTNGTGRVTGNSNVTNVGVSCAALPPPPPPEHFSVGGTVSGLDGQVVLRNGAENLAVTTNGPFAFATQLPSGAAYDVSVATQPEEQACTVANGRGRVDDAAVTNVAVTCVTTAPATFSIGGVLSGLQSGSVQLGLQHAGGGGSAIELTADGPFTFGADRVEEGDTYTVSILAQPAGHECSVTNGSGTATADVTDVQVACESEDGEFSVGGTIVGLVGAGLRIETGRSNAVTVEPGAGTFRLPESFEDQAPFDVGIAEQPKGQTCVIAQSQGVVQAADVEDIAVTCVDGVTDGLRGTFAVSTPLRGTVGYLTLFRDGVYVYGTVENDPACGGQNGNGAEYGAYDFQDSTGAFTIRNAVVDTNGTCGAWNGGSRFSGVLTSSGSGGDRMLLLTLTGGGLVELKPIESRRDALWGSFADAYRRNVWVFTRTGDDEQAIFYFNVHTQRSDSLGHAPGIEYACATLQGGDHQGELTPDLTATCAAPAPGVNGPVDTNGAAGLSGVSGPWPFHAHRDELTTPTFHGFRVGN